MYKYFLSVIILSLTITSCSILGSDDDDLIGDWRRVSSFEGIPRSSAISFSINGKAYLGTGYNGDEDDEDDRLVDFWEYDPVRNFWIQKSDFPGVGRSSAVSFVAKEKGYVGTGFNDDIEGDYLKDFWEYDPGTNSWSEIAEFGGSARYAAVAFSIDDIGYVGTGNDDNDLKDFWKYDPDKDQWEQIVSLPGAKRIDAVAFVINRKAYVGTGRNNGIYESDFWMYDPDTELWTRLHDIDEDEDEDPMDIPRSKAVAFTVNGKGYIALGNKGGNKTDIWEYNPSNDTWTDDDLADFEGYARRQAVVFTLDNLAYVGTGTSGTIYFDDIWEYNPLIENDEDTY